MADADFSLLLSGVLGELKGLAWTRHVKLVCDWTHDFEIDLDPEELTASIRHFGTSLIAQAAPGSSLCVMTSLESQSKRSVDQPSTFSNMLSFQWSGPLTKDPKDHDATLQALQAVFEAGDRNFKPLGGLSNWLVTDDSWNFCVAFPKAKVRLVLMRRHTALVCDDDIDVQMFLSAALATKKVRVIPVHDGFDALLAIERYQPDLVMTDIVMPNMNGLDLTARIKAVTPELPVILFSGHRDILLQGGDAAPDRILAKPMSLKDVCDAYEALVPAIDNQM